MALGAALLLAAIGLIIRAYLRLLEHARRRDGRAPPLPEGPPRIAIRPLATILLGALGGLVVGITSVGSGSLIIIALMALYPRLTANELVGTDLVQAVPLVASAALGHILFGDFQMDLTTSLLLGCIPGVASALKLLNVPNRDTAIILAIVLVFAPVLWMLVRRRHGFPALARGSRRKPDRARKAS